MKNTAFALLLLIFGLLFSANTRIHTEGADHLAVGGNDVTTYFEDNGPLPGKKEYAVSYQGAKWLFASEKNKEKFEKNPERYIPAYGGYCVWAISNNRLVPGEPHLWYIYENKLYLLCSEDALSNWLEDPVFHNQRADKNWPELIKKGS